MADAAPPAPALPLTGDAAVGERPAPAALPPPQTVPPRADAEPAAGARPPEDAPAEAPAPTPSAPAPGTLSVVVQPWAEVVVDGRSAGTTPLRGPLPLPAGPHRVVLRNAAFPDHAVTVEVEPGEDVRLAVSLWSLVARVTLAVSPWAEVEVDGRAAGTTPLREPLVLAPGAHVIRLTHPTLGTREETVEVSAGEARTLRVRMDASGGGNP
jgi:serine/threonine-protein kinase